ncbi:MAG: Integral membrane protein, partial [uncultured Solirubrobacteraceae bacterium]
DAPRLPLARVARTPGPAAGRPDHVRRGGGAAGALGAGQLAVERPRRGGGPPARRRHRPDHDRDLGAHPPGLDPARAAPGAGDHRQRGRDRRGDRRHARGARARERRPGGPAPRGGRHHRARRRGLRPLPHRPARPGHARRPDDGPGPAHRGVHPRDAGRARAERLRGGRGARRDLRRRHARLRAARRARGAARARAARGAGRGRRL